MIFQNKFFTEHLRVIASVKKPVQQIVVSEYSGDKFNASKFSYVGHCNISPNNKTSLETIFKNITFDT